MVDRREIESKKRKVKRKRTAKKKAKSGYLSEARTEIVEEDERRRERVGGRELVGINHFKN